MTIPALERAWDNIRLRDTCCEPVEENWDGVPLESVGSDRTVVADDDGSVVGGDAHGMENVVVVDVLRTETTNGVVTGGLYPGEEGVREGDTQRSGCGCMEHGSQVCHTAKSLRATAGGKVNDAEEGDLDETSQGYPDERMAVGHLPMSLESWAEIWHGEEEDEALGNEVWEGISRNSVADNAPNLPEVPQSFLSEQQP